MYAHYELSSIELKKEVIKYLKNIDPKHPDLDRIKDIHENRFSTVGKYMYILNHGGDLPEDVLPRLMPSFEKILNEEEAKIAAAKKEAEYVSQEGGSDKKVDDTPKMVITIQDRLQEKAREVAGEVEGWIDEFCADKKEPVKTVEDFVNLFKTYELKGPHARYMQNIFERRAAEITEAAAGTNKDLNEAYSNFSKPEIKKFALFHANLLKACVMLQEVAKASRAPKKKKPVSQDKLVAKIKYKKEDSLLGLASISPIQILGAKEVWCFDTKTRKLIRYVADDLLGPLSVKGVSIIGFNEAKSVSKTLRKPADQLAAFKKCGKIQLRTFMDEIGTTGITPTGKVNENQIILKVL